MGPSRASWTGSPFWPAQVSRSIVGQACTSRPRQRASGTAGGLGTSWNRHVVVEVPATERDFASVLGKPGGSYASIAAVTHRATAAGDAIRIVVNPKTAQLTSSAVQSVLEHEMVHGDPLTGFACADLG